MDPKSSLGPNLPVDLEMRTVVKRIAQTLKRKVAEESHIRIYSVPLTPTIYTNP